MLTHTDAGGAFITTNGGTRDGSPLTYDYMGNVREFPADAEVPLDDLRRAVHEFVMTGRRSSAVRRRPDN
nr:Imm1 family immunity protein [Saccharothrix ecbatanensis]